MAGAVAERWCAGCREVRDFEVPPCEDGHGEDCLDLACVDCGWAVVLGVAVVEPRIAAAAVPSAA
jgi:hypothetical protein